MPFPFMGDLLACQKCTLCSTRTQVVPGEGNERANVLLIAEATGTDEDDKGRPLVGRSGVYLRRTLINRKFPMEDLFVTNVVRCHSPSNRDPTPEELLACNDWTDQFLKAIRPRIVVTAGRFAMKEMGKRLGVSDIEKTSILNAAGQPYASTKPHGVYLYPLTHPAYIGRSKEYEWFDTQVDGLVTLYNDVVLAPRKKKAALKILT